MIYTNNALFKAIKLTLEWVYEPFGELAGMINLLNCFAQLLINDFALFD